ncbi:MAG TPA: YSC84-related protein [Anaeromyxobacter sp.]
MKKQMKTMAGALAALAVGVAAASSLAGEPTATGSGKSAPQAAASHGLVKDAEATFAAFERADPSLARFFNSAVGYAIFPSVGKGAAGIGGAYGRGVLFEHGKPTGRSTLTQVTIGAQLGGQAYSEIVFFENEDALASFKKGQYAMAAQVSAVAVSAGASANARYARGVAVFTLAKAGLMAEASVGGQKFGFRPFTKAM